MNVTLSGQHCGWNYRVKARQAVAGDYSCPDGETDGVTRLDFVFRSEDHPGFDKNDFYLLLSRQYVDDFVLPPRDHSFFEEMCTYRVDKMLMLMAA